VLIILGFPGYVHQALR